MGEDGIVSIWLGNFSDDGALLEYADDVGTQPSQFLQDFFDGDLTPFNMELWERAVVKPSDNIAEIVKTASYGETFEIDGIKLNKTYNAAILVYNYHFEALKTTIDAPVEFIAAVRYDNLNR